MCSASLSGAKRAWLPPTGRTDTLQTLPPFFDPALNLASLYGTKNGKEENLQQLKPPSCVFVLYLQSNERVPRLMHFECHLRDQHLFNDKQALHYFQPDLQNNAKVHNLTSTAPPSGQNPCWAALSFIGIKIVNNTAKLGTYSWESKAYFITVIII